MLHGDAERRSRSAAAHSIRLCIWMVLLMKTTRDGLSVNHALIMAGRAKMWTTVAALLLPRTVMEILSLSNMVLSFEEELGRCHYILDLVDGRVISSKPPSSCRVTRLGPPLLDQPSTPFAYVKGLLRIEKNKC